MFNSKYVMCAASSDSASHAIYQFDIRRKHHEFFENCIEETVRHLDEAPFIQTLSSFDNMTFKRFHVKNKKHVIKFKNIFTIIKNIK